MKILVIYLSKTYCYGCDDCDDGDLILAESMTRVEEGVEGGLDILQEVGKHHDDVQTNDDDGNGNDDQYHW